MTTVVASSARCDVDALRPGWVAVDEGHIVDVGDGDAPAGAVDLGDAVLAPGYVDLQVNGVGPDDFAGAAPVEWSRAARTLLAHGVTAYCPTFVSAPLTAYKGALDRASSTQARAVHDGLPVVLGVHLEGPFLGAAPGAHPAELLQPVDVGFLSALLDRFPDLVRVVTLAPEADPGLRGTRLLVDAGVVVALGHSRASYAEVVAAADAGATVVTHLFNGMAPLHHREPGIVGAALDDDRLTPTLIADLVHVDPVAIRIALQAKERVALVSDAVAVTDDLDTSRGAAALSDGTLTGATALLDRAVANVVALGVPVHRAVSLASRIPCDVLGRTDRGRLEVGAVADLVVLDPDSLGVREVWLRGDRAHLPGDA